MTIFWPINKNTVFQVYKPQEANLGIRLSIILHAIFVCILINMKNHVGSEVMTPQYVEVASLTLKPESKRDIISRPDLAKDETPFIRKTIKPKSSPQTISEVDQAPKSVASTNSELAPIMKEGESGADPSAGSSEFGTGPVGGGLGSGDGTGTGIGSGSGLGLGSGANSSGMAEGNGEGGIGLGDEGFWNEYGSKLQIICERFKRYPPIAVRRGWQGTVEVLVHFFPDGKTIRVTIEKSAGQRVLDDEAIVIIQQGLKELPLPAIYQGRDVKLIMPIDFKLVE